MTPQEILSEIYKLPFSEQSQIAETLLKNKDFEKSGEPKMTEDEFAQYLFEKGLIRNVPLGLTEEEFDFEPIQIEGEPLSETIIRERR